MNLFRTNSYTHFYLTLFLWAITTAFPTEVSESTQTTQTKNSRPKDVTSTESFNSKALQPQNASSISTTSSLLFKDKKPILTYLLGQPKKQGSVSSPAHLLSPDRYEFFTFDDDGQIVKKLMSVKEIQKIIANNEKGSLGEHGSPIEYYQILTVTPDVESIPSVSRINPNEPLFSIHDVIASVQNVLKSEIKIKQSQSLSKLNNTNFLASASSEHFEILTEKPTSAFKHEVQKVTSSSSQQTTNAPPSTFTIRQETSSGTEKATISEINYTFVQENIATKDAPTTQIPISLAGSTVTPAPASIVPTFGTLKPLASSSQEVLPLMTSTSKITVAALAQESQPLSLNDAHPGLLSNDTFFDMKPLTLEQISRIAEPLIQELKASPSSNFTGNFVKVETVQPAQVKPVKAGETSTSKVEIPITPDLAESVSNVLWQIASENSMVDGANKPTEPFVLSAETKIPETFEKAESNHPVKVTPFVTTTELPAQSRSTEKLSENPVAALENILRPQNRPRPFQKVPLIEKETPDTLESRVEPFSTATPTYDPVPSPSSTVVILTEEEPNPTPEVQLANVTGSFSSTAPPQSFVISVSPDAVVQSPEQLKPVTDKISVVNLNGTSGQNQSQTIEGVQVIQEANIGQIPRTTEYPGQIVKEMQRMEIPSTESVANEESLVNSASNIYTTQVPEMTTISENVEKKTEIPEKFENVVETTTLNLELAELKNNPNEELKQISASDRIDITFVPMVIKTPSAFKQEALLKAESQTETKEQLTTTENSISEQTEVTEADLTETPNPTPQQDFESKELPETTPEFINNAPKTTTEVAQKETIFSDDADFQIGSLKQNIPSKPHFGKPQKPVYIKPVKAKPVPDVKTPKPSATVKPFLREPESKKPYENHLQSSPSVLELDAAPAENLGLEATVANLDGDVKRFADLCNELAFSLWSSVTHNGLSFVRSVVISPFAVTSLLAMVFLGARGPTSGQMNDILKLDDMVTFNPHLVFRNVTESLVISRNPGVATTAFVRELYSDKSKGKLLDFYKERVQQFYDGHVEEVNFKTIGDTLRRQTNHLVKRQTWGKITDFLRGSNLMPRPPLAAFSANIFQTDCTRASTRDRDGEMYFVILPASRLRRLVPIPAVVWRDGFLAGYESNLDATAVSISPPDSAVSTIFVLPGQQGLIAPGDTLARLEHHLLGSSYRKGHWSRLMRSLLPRPGLELQIPRMSHKSVINVTSSLQRMGLKDLFSADKADLTGLNGLANDLHLSDMLQVNLFSTCGEEPIGARHHSEIYPATPILRREKSADNVFSESVDNLFAVSDFEDPAISALPLELRPRQARVPLSTPGVRIPEPPRLRFDRPFLFFVRHNPTGLILHMGRFNPRLMP